MKKKKDLICKNENKNHREDGEKSILFITGIQEGEEKITKKTLKEILAWNFLKTDEL